jgi:hypothetical protein
MTLLFWLIVLLALLIYAYFKYLAKIDKRGKKWKIIDKIIKSFLLIYTAVGIFNIYINPSVITTEYVKSDINGALRVQYSITELLEIKEITNFLMPIVKKDVVYSRKNIHLATHKPKNEVEAKKYLYEVTYKHRKLF